MSKSINFTARSVVMAGIPVKVDYSMDGDTIIIREKGEEKDPLFVFNPGDPYYGSALAAHLAKQAHRSAGSDAAADTSFYGMRLKAPKYYEICMDSSIGRATITFKKKPAPAVRELVKEYGFYWSPVNKCWSRKLNTQAWIAAQAIHSKLGYSA